MLIYIISAYLFMRHERIDENDTADFMTNQGSAKSFH